MLLIELMSKIFIFLVQPRSHGLSPSRPSLDPVDGKKRDPGNEVAKESQMTEVFEERTRSEAGQTSKKVEVPRRGIKIVTQREVEERNRKQIPQNTRKATAWH